MSVWSISCLVPAQPEALRLEQRDTEIVGGEVAEGKEVGLCEIFLSLVDPFTFEDNLMEGRLSSSLTSLWRREGALSRKILVDQAPHRGKSKHHVVTAKDVLQSSPTIKDPSVASPQHLPNTPNTCLLYTSDAADE